jgi:suppressor for copper-sensitivity B
MKRSLVAVLTVILTACLFESPGGRADDSAPPAFGGDFDPLAEVSGQLGEPVAITAVIERGTGGAADVLAVTATLEAGWHLYAVTQKPGGPLATRITVAADSPRQAAGAFVSSEPPHTRTVDDVPAWKGLAIEEHAGTVTWRAPLAAGPGEARGSVRLQLCQDTSCLPPRSIAFVATAGGSAAAGPASPAPGQPSAAPRADVATHVPLRSHVTLEASFGAARQESGRKVWPLVVRLVPAPGWHLYRPAGTAETEIGQGKPTIVALESQAERVVAVRATEAEPAAGEELAAAGAVEGPVRLEILLADDPEAEEPVGLVLGFQTCSDTTCDPPAGVRLAVDPPAADAGEPLIDFEAAKYGEAAKSPARLTVAAAAVVPAPTSPAAEAVGLSLPAASQASSLSLPLALLMGLAGGLILNLMPCVLPVLGLKLMSFAQQSGRARQEVFQMNLWYCAGLFAVFFVLATASVAANLGLASTNLGWGQQFGSVPFKIGMLGVVFAFALSFLGVWELPIPGFIGEKAGHVQSQEGPLGAFLKGVLSTVLATPCSGPFLGPVFGYTLTQPTAVTYAVFGSIALGMSLPYILVGLFPGLVKFLPKPGAWMATFKELLGFVMLGTVAYLFYLLRQQPEWFVPTFVMLVGIWFGCWWVGRAQEATGMVGFGRWLQAAAMGAALAATGFLWLGPHDSLIEWEKPFSPTRLAELRRGGATVMIDFTADWCPTCKLNLATAIETDRVKATLDKNRVVPVLADWSDGSDEIREFIERLGSRSIPLLAIYPGSKPGEPLRDPIVLRDLLTEGQVIAALEQAGPSCCPPPELRAAAAPAAAGR